MRRRNKDKFQSNLTRKVRHLPYGSVRGSGYGGELYIKNVGLVCGGLINKRHAREEGKNIIKEELSYIE